MTRAALAALAVAGLAGCGGCPRAGGSADAGGAPTRVDVRRQGIDLRTALVLVYPEFRYTALVDGSARVTRVLRWRPDGGEPGALADALAPELRRTGFATGRDGGEPGALAVRHPFSLFAAARAEDETLRLEVVLPLRQDDVGKLLHSPNPLSSDQLATLLPQPPGAALLDESFTLELRYTGREERVDLVVRQVVDLLLASDWKAVTLPDGWGAVDPLDAGARPAVPRALEAELLRQATRARIRVVRRGPEVEIRFTLPLRTSGAGG